MTKITICGHDIPLLFNLASMELAEKTFGSIDEMMKLLNGQAKTGALIDIVTIMANTAQAESGGEPIFTREWFSKKIPVGYLGEVSKAVGEAFTSAMKMETNGGELDEDEHDPVLEALERKKGGA